MSRLDKNTMIERFSSALYEGRGVFFVGSGLTKSITNACWIDILKPHEKELNLTISNDDDLPAIAQYLINSRSGNRGVLQNAIVTAFNGKTGSNAYLDAIKNTKLRTIWTTNYDTALENLLSTRIVDVKSSDSAMSRPMSEYDVEIIKMHGCARTSGHNDLVITSEDYENYEQNHPAIVGRLRSDLLEKIFLFIGYSYRDKNIQNVIIEARRQARKATQEHYIILKKEDLEEQKRKRYEYWLDDLARFGLMAIEIDNYKELETILQKISKKSRGNTVYISGGHNSASTVARSLGKKIASMKQVILNTGQSSGIGSEVLAGFSEACVSNKEDLVKRLKIFPNPYAAKEAYSNDLSLIPELKRHRTPLFGATQITIFFEGGIGTEMEFNLALENGCTIIPAPTKDLKGLTTLMKKMLHCTLVAERLKETDIDYFNAAMKGDVSADQVINVIRRFLD